MHPRLHLLDLPLEIHSKILFASLQDSFTDDADETRCRPHINPQTNLALVCRLWANLITSVPELWTQLSVDISRSSDEDAQRRLRRASDVLAKLEYSISMLIMAIGNNRPSVAVHQAVIDFIARHIDRCQVLDFRVPATCWSMMCEQGLEGLEAKRLETLRVRSSAARQEAKIFDLTKRAPRLSSFTCAGIYTCMVKLPWQNLTNLDLRDLMVGECLSVLAQTSNVEHLSIVNVAIGWEEHPSAVSMAHLKSLTVFDHAEYELYKLMDKLEAPRLEYLSWMSDVLANKSLTLDNMKRFIRGAAELATFVVIHNDPDAVTDWTLDLWRSIPPLEVAILKTNVLEFIKAPSLEVGRRYGCHGTKEWDDVLIFLPRVVNTL